MKRQPHLVPDPQPRCQMQPHLPAIALQARRFLPQRSCEQAVALENALNRPVPKIGPPYEIEDCEPAADVHRFTEADPQPLARDADLLRPHWTTRSGQHARHLLRWNELPNQPLANLWPLALEQLELRVQRSGVQVLFAA